MNTETKEKIKVCTADEMCSRLPTQRAEIASLLRLAADMIEAPKGYTKGQRDDSASWRVADALVMLKNINTENDLPGIDSHTGRGGRLSIKR